MSLYVVHYKDYEGDSQYGEVRLATPAEVVTYFESRHCTVIKIYEVSHVWTPKTTLEGREP